MLIRHLAEKAEYFTAEELSRKVEVSVRTIKRYIGDVADRLREYDVEILSTKGIGYKLHGSPKQIYRLRQATESYLTLSQLDDSTEGRIGKVICAFLNNTYLNAETLSELLHLSIASTNKLLAEVKKRLHQYELEIVSKPFYGSCLVGDELKIRKLILDYAIKNDERNIVELRLNAIEKTELKEIETSITVALTDNKIILADKDFNLLLTRVLIAVARSRQKSCLKTSELAKNHRLHNYEFIQGLLREIGKKLNVAISEAEISYVSSSSGIIIYDYNTRTKLTLDEKEEEQL